MSRLAPRRVAVLLALLVAVLVILASAASRVSNPATPLPPVTASAPASTVEARLPADGTVRARVGQVVRLHVQATNNDVAEIAALALSMPVGPGLDTPLVFVAEQPGRFPVRLRYADEPVGQLVVTPPRGS
jgi:hypothetical protein